MGLIFIGLPDSHGSAQPADNQDYSAQLRRIAPKSSDEAIQSFRIHPDFRIELVAAEPLVASPVAIDFDEDGRMYVAEFPEFNQTSSKTPQGSGRIRLLDDTDSDGTYDKSTIFLNNLASPTAVCCYAGGVFVGAAPDILYAKDVDGDGQADHRRTIFTGFARDALGEGLLNSFRWSFDNRIHVQTSFNGGSVRHIDKPDSDPISVRGQGFSFNPSTEQFELTSGGGQHGMSLDDWGRKFVNTNHKPFHLLMYDRRYLARNPYLQAPQPALEIAPGGYHTKVFRISPDEPWRVVRTRLRTTGVMDPHPTEGAEPSGFYTACSGVTVYRGDAWPAEFRSDVFVGEVANNIVHRARLVSDGVGLIAQRADPKSEFFASTDVWHRPVQMANGPDGNLYVVDMYRNLIQGASILPPSILNHVDVSGGFDMGRIYRIVPRIFQRPKLPRLSQASTAELVKLLEHANGWHRDTASRLLFQRQDRQAVDPLRHLSASSKVPLARMLSLYALDGLKSLDAALIIERLRDADSRVREHALRLAESFIWEPEISDHLMHMTADPDLRVRNQLAFSLGEIPGDEPVPALVQLALRDGADTWCRLAILSSVHTRSGKIFRLLSEQEQFRNSIHGREMLLSLAKLIGRANRDSELAEFSTALETIPDSEQTMLRDLLWNLCDNLSAQRIALLRTNDGTHIQRVLQDMLRDATITAADHMRPVDERVSSIRTLSYLALGESQQTLASLLNFRQPQVIQAAAIDTLARFDEPAVSQILLKAWPGFSPQLRARATDALFSRPAWSINFLDAIENGQIQFKDVDPLRIQLLQSHADKSVRNRTSKLVNGTKIARRQDILADYRPALTLSGDRARGQELFKKECSACHQLDGIGTQIGADLNAMRSQDAETLLLNILDPNREVKPQFLSYLLLTNSGRIVTGMITEETATSITIRRNDGTFESLQRIDIEELRSSQLSFMPEGLEKAIAVPAMADLLAYLGSTKQ